MHTRALVSSLLLAFALSGCASFSAPTADSLANVPVVRFGNPVPKSGDFILYFPAGYPIPVVASVTGTALAKSDEHTLHVTLNRDIYAYKREVSFDKIHWQPAKRVLGFRVIVKIPSPGHPEAGEMAMQIDLK